MAMGKGRKRRPKKRKKTYATPDQVDLGLCLGSCACDRQTVILGYLGIAAFVVALLALGSMVAELWGVIR